MADFNYSTSGNIVIAGAASVPSFAYTSNPTGITLTDFEITDFGGPLGPAFIPLGNQNNFFPGGGLGGDPSVIVPLGVFDSVNYYGAPFGPFLFISENAVNYVGNGTLILSGDTISQLGSYPYTGDGTLILSGDAITLRGNLTYTGDGTLVLDGGADAQLGSYPYTGDGTIVLGGDADAQLGAFAFTGDGTIVLGGDGIGRITQSYQYGGGGTLNLGGAGNALLGAYSYAGSGPLVLGGNADATKGAWVWQSRFVRIIVGGNSFSTLSYFKWLSRFGRISINGNAGAEIRTKHYIRSPNGLISLGGTAQVRVSNRTYVGKGSFGPLSGVSDAKITGYRPQPTGGIRLINAAIAARTSYRYIGDPPFVLGGEAIVSYTTTPTAVTYEGDGTLVLDSNFFDPTIVNATFTAAVDVNWQIEGTVSNEISFSWNVGRQPLYWFRVVGACLSPTCNNSGLDLNGQTCNLGSGGQQFIQYFLATDLTDVCKQLSAKNALKWQISSIGKFSRPADADDIASQEAAGIDHSCNKLENIDFTNIPDCLELTAETPTPVRMGMTAIIQDQFVTYIGGGKIYLFGSAKVNSYNYFSSGSLFLSGDTATAIDDNRYTGSGGLLLGSESAVVFSDWKYNGNGDLVLEGGIEQSADYYVATGKGSILLQGNANASEKLRYKAFGIPLLVGGDAGIQTNILHFADGGNGVFILGGEANCASDTWNYSGEGGLALSGEAATTAANQHYVADGQMVLGGTAVLVFRQISEGGFALSGDAVAVPLVKYDGGGLMLLDGELQTSSPSYAYDVGGDLIVLGGDSDAMSNYFEGYVTLGGRIANVLLESDFATADLGNSVLPVDTSTVSTNCGCNPVPLSLVMTHNLINTSIFGDFIRRNNLKFSDQMILQYRDFDGMWQRNFHFIGISERNTKERWSMVFEWGCTDSLGGSVLDRPGWRFSISIVRRDFISGVDNDTRILYVFPKEMACQNNSIAFSFTINPKTAVATPVDVTAGEILGNILYDNIGLFKSKFWLTTPIRINIAGSPVSTVDNTFDIFPIFPSDENIFAN